MMRWTSYGAALLGFLICHPLALAAEPDCVWKGMRQRPAELISPCTAILANENISREARGKALLIRGIAYHNLLQLDSAMQDYMAAMEIMPDNVDLLVSRANIYQRNGRWDLRDADLAKAAAINPDHVDLLIALGDVARRGGDDHHAVKFFSRAIKNDSKATFAYLFRKRAFVRMNELPKALTDADAAVRVSQEPDQPNYFEDDVARDIHVAALIERAQLLDKMGEPERAARDYEAAVAKDRSAFALIKRVQDVKRPLASDLADLQEAIRREPENTKAIYTLGLTLMIEELFDAALIVFNRAIDINPNHGYSLRMRARVHRQAGRTEEALRDFLRAINSDERILKESMPALRAAGYWHSKEIPNWLTPELEDALRACMIDTSCN